MERTAPFARSALLSWSERATFFEPLILSFHVVSFYHMDRTDLKETRYKTSPTCRRRQSGVDPFFQPLYKTAPLEAEAPRDPLFHVCCGDPES